MQTNSSNDFANDWSTFTGGFLSHDRRTPEYLGVLLDRHPNEPMGPLAKGFLLLMLAKAELRPAAEDCLREALRRGAHTRGARSARLAEGLAAWLAGDPQAAIQHVEAVIAHHPLDAFCVKVSHAMRFMLGDAIGMRRSLARVVSIYTEDMPFAGHIRGCYAFALEETGDYREAERMGRRAVELAPDDAWGRHAVAHVLEMTGRASEGLRWLGHEQDWAHCNNFGFHMFWHRALFLLELERTVEALTLYDQAVRADATDDFRDIANAASLLQRLELQGVNVGNRWDELADKAERRIDDRQLAFADLHYMLALLGAGRTSSAMRLAQGLLGAGGDHNGALSSAIAAPAAEGLLAFTAGDHGAAVMHLAPVMEMLSHVGGSHAQRDVFAQVYLESLVRSGHPLAGQELAQRHLARNGRNSFAQQRLRAISRRSDVALASHAAIGLTPQAVLH